MTCRQCVGIERTFDDKTARKDLKSYLKKGPSKTTGYLLSALRAAGVEGLSVLDIGGGVGAIQHALAGSAPAITSVDAAGAYLAIAREQASQRGYDDRATYHYGDFVDLAPEVEPADIVTLDRVICCYHDMVGLVSLSAERARRFYGLVYPRDAWWLRPFQPLANLILRLSRNPFRIFIHPTEAVDRLVRQAGFRQRYYRPAGFWQVVLYERAAP